MPNPSPQSPEFQRLVEEIARKILEGGHASQLLPGFSDRTLTVRTHVRTRSPLQRAVLEATRAGLMRRDARGRFVGLDPRVRRQIALIQRTRRRKAMPTRAQIRADQQAVFALLKSIE